MGPIERRLAMVESEARDLARRRVLSAIHELTDEDLERHFGGGRWPASPADVGIPFELLRLAVGECEGDEFARRSKKLLEPLWERVRNVRQRSRA